MSPSHGRESGPKLGILYVPGLMMTLAGHTGSWRVPYLPRNPVDRTPFILKQVQFPTCLEGMFYPFSKHHMHVCQPILLLDKYRSYGERKRDSPDKQVG